MRWFLLIGCLGMWSTCSAVSFVSLRDIASPNTKVADVQNWTTGQLPDSLWRDSSFQFIRQPLAYLQRESLGEMCERLKGKRILIFVHGMAKTLSTAQTDFFNGLWAWEQVKGNTHVDEVLLVSWPGTAQVSIAGYLKANRLASKTGRQFRLLLDALNAAGCRTEVITHSMGSKVALRALKSGGKCEDLHLMAPSIWKWTVRPGRKWARGINGVNGICNIFYSRGDWAFNFTAINKMGLGFNGVYLRKSERLAQMDCTRFVNQEVFRELGRNRFRVRSNHSMYWQTLVVFERIRATVNL